MAQEEQKIALLGKRDKINKSKLNKEKTKAQEPSKTPQEIQREVKAKQNKDGQQKAKEAEKDIQGMSPDQKDNYCDNIFHDIKVLTNGGGTITNPNDYIKNGKSLLFDDTGKYPLGYITKSILMRIDQLRNDKKTGNNLYVTKKDGKNSWGGHQNAVNIQKEALQGKLKEYDDRCGDHQLSPEDAAILAKARKNVKLPTPNEPDPLPIKNLNTRNSTNLPKVNPVATRKVKDAPWISSKIGSRTIDKIQRVVDKGWDYFNSEQGRKQMMEILKLLPPVVAVKVIIEIGKYVFPVLMPQDRVQEPTKEDRPIVTTDTRNPTSLTTNPTGMALQFTNNPIITPAKVNEAENIASNPTTTLIFDTLKYLNGESPPPVNIAAAKVADNPNSTTTSIDQTNQILASLLASNNPTVANNTPQQKTNAVNPGIQMSM
jgi:hypothetical protein